MDIVICANCGDRMERYEDVEEDGQVIQRDWTMESPAVCRVCRRVPGAEPFQKNHDVLGGFPWKRDDQGRKVKK